MEYEIGKTFKSGGKLLKPGDPLPDDLDKVTLDHYKRHGMVREVKPQESKPEASKRRTSTQRPKETKPAGPVDSGQLAGQLDASEGNDQLAANGAGQADGAVQTSAQDAGAGTPSLPLDGVDNASATDA